jgi:hypothetical protein
MVTSPRYVEALGWAEELHRHQSRHGKAVPFLSHVISDHGGRPGGRNWGKGHQ